MVSSEKTGQVGGKVGIEGNVNDAKKSWRTRLSPITKVVVRPPGSPLMRAGHYIYFLPLFVLDLLQ